jgi:hypothetical protein
MRPSWPGPGINSSAGKDQRQRLDRTQQPISRPGPGRGCGWSWPERHLPRRPLPTDRPPTRQDQGHRRGRSIPAGDHLASPCRPDTRFHEPRRRPPRPPRQHPCQQAQPHPPTRTTRLPRHPSNPPPDTRTCLIGSIFRSVTPAPMLAKRRHSRRCSLSHAQLDPAARFRTRRLAESGRRSIWTCGSRWSRSGSATRSSSTGLDSDSSGRHGLGGERSGTNPRPTSWALNRSMLSIAVIA